MISKTSRTKRSNTKKRGSQNHNQIQAADIGDDCAASELTKELTKMEEAMNMNGLLHPATLENCPTALDTRISACNDCGKRLVNFAAAIHHHEFHSCQIKNELDDAVAAQMTEAAL